METNKKNANSGMTRAERLELAKVVRLRAKVTLHDIDQKVAQQLAHVEAQLAAQYSPNHEKWAHITKRAGELVAQGDKEIATLCREMGIPPSFRPSLHISWIARGENAAAGRRIELRRIAQAQLEAQARTAKCAVERREAELLTEITAGGLTSDAAREFLAALPTPDELMPALELAELERSRPLPSLPGDSEGGE